MDRDTHYASYVLRAHLRLTSRLFQQNTFLRVTYRLGPTPSSGWVEDMVSEVGLGRLTGDVESLTFGDAEVFGATCLLKIPSLRGTYDVTAQDQWPLDRFGCLTPVAPTLTVSHT